MIKKLKKEIKSCIIAGLIVVSFKTFFFSNFHIPSGSMIPTLLVGDKLILSKLEYGITKHSVLFGIFPIKKPIMQYNKPSYGDVVVFAYPKQTNIAYIKRLVANENDEIVFNFNGKIESINGIKIEHKTINSVNTDHEEYIEKNINQKEYKIILNKKYSNLKGNVKFVVPKGHFFASGDNRHNSKDSRFEDPGFIPYENIVGKAKWIYFSSDSSILNPVKFIKGIRWKRIFSNII